MNGETTTGADISAPRGIRQDETGSLLLRALSPGEYALLAPHLVRVPFAVGDELAKAGASIDHFCFPEGAIAAVIDPLEDGRRLAVGLVGNEGFLGWPRLLGDDRWPYDVVMRAADGTALRIEAATMMELASQHEGLRRRLLQFANVFMLQMGRTIVSSLVHPVEKRMARWILLYHDRLETDEIFLTHEEFRLMLGVRRSSVTDALHRLEAEQAVRGLRGRVVVRDRARLAELAGDTYGYPEREYRRLILREPEPPRLAEPAIAIAG